jgi:hypothetical protein
LASGQTIRQSARQAGKSESCFARRRRVDPTFAAAWEEALKIGAPFEADVWRKFLGLVAQGLAINRAARLVGRCIIHLKNRLNHDQALKQAYAEAEAQGRATRLESFRSADLKAFLAAIGSGQTVAQAAKLAGSSLNAVYCLRKHDPKFAQDWAEAIKAKAPKPEIDPPGPKPGQA